MTVTDADRRMLARAVELARMALEAGDEPFGSVLTDAAGSTLFEDRNRTSGGDETRHPEFEIARWAANNLEPDQRARGRRLHLRRALPDVLGRARLGRARTHRLRGIGHPDQRMALRVGSMHRAPSPCCPSRPSRPASQVDGPVEPFATEVKELLRRSLGLG